MIFKSTGKRGLFEEQSAIDLMSEMGNSLERLSKVVYFEMFKILVLQRLFGMSDKQVQYQITDRLSFKEFLGLSSGDKVPDEKSAWAFREKLTNSGIVEELFAIFYGYLNEPLTDEQKLSNRAKSKVRARVEHVFGFMEQTMQGLHLHSGGLNRAKGIIGLINLTYNLCRFEQLMRIRTM